MCSCFVSINRNYWKMSSKKNEPVMGPMSISERWPALPAAIDSAFEDLLTKKLYFFSGKDASYGRQDSSVTKIPCADRLHTIFPSFVGTRFWVYTGKNVMGPRSIEKLGLPNSVQKVEGALQRGKGKVLLFSGENFWR